VSAGGAARVDSQRSGPPVRDARAVGATPGSPCGQQRVRPQRRRRALLPVLLGVALSLAWLPVLPAQAALSVQSAPAVQVLQAVPAGAGLLPRQVAAPPEDLLSGRLRPPAPAWSQSPRALLRARFVERAGGGWQARLALPVEVDGPLTLLPLAPDALAFRLQLAGPDPSAGERDLAAESAAGRAQREQGVLPLGPGLATAAFSLPVVAGEHRLLLSVDGRRRPDGYVLVTTPGPAVLESRLGHLRLLAGEAIPLQASLRAHAGPEAPRLPLGAARLHLRRGGLDLTLPLFDDGRHDDGLPGDGLVGGAIPPLPPGELFVQLELQGLDAQGRGVLRTAERTLPLLPRAGLLSGEALLLPRDDGRLGLHVGAWILVEGVRTQLAAEVWGRDAQGEFVPLCWLSTMLPPSQAGEAWLPLALDRRWLERVGATPPLELRQLRLADPDTGLAYDLRERLAVAGSDPGAASGAANAGPVPGGEASGAQPVHVGPSGLVTPSMTMGPSPLVGGALPGLGSVRASGLPWNPERALMLSHGYCSGGGIWPLGDFTGQVLQFVDPDANRSHDEFAQLLGAYGSQVDSFGFLGHSQGGCAALHLYTHYVSGLDQALGPRRIQAVASPWAGSPLASSLAGLGGIFGVGCGSNFDLSDDGAALWLASIPSWARDEVWFWTTQNSGSACNFLTNLFLDSPNDGVVERAKGQLPGGHNMGHISGWCHTTGMSNTANYLDHVRNVERDAAAAR